MAERNFGAWTMHPDPLWTNAAAQWEGRWVTRETEPGHMLGEGRRQWHLVCGCGQSMYCAVPDAAAGEGYAVSPSIILAGVMDHIRKCHEHQVITAASHAV